MNYYETIENIKLEHLILNICFALWDSLYEHSIMQESNQYIRLVRK